MSIQTESAACWRKVKIHLQRDVLAKSFNVHQQCEPMWRAVDPRLRQRPESPPPETSCASLAFHLYFEAQAQIGIVFIFLFQS